MPARSGGERSLGRSTSNSWPKRGGAGWPAPRPCRRRVRNRPGWRSKCRAPLPPRSIGPRTPEARPAPPRPWASNARPSCPGAAALLVASAHLAGGQGLGRQADGLKVVGSLRKNAFRSRRGRRPVLVCDRLSAITQSARRVADADCRVVFVLSFCPPGTAGRYGRPRTAPAVARRRAAGSSSPGVCRSPANCLEPPRARLGRLSMPLAAASASTQCRELLVPANSVCRRGDRDHADMTHGDRAVADLRRTDCLRPSLDAIEEVLHVPGRAVQPVAVGQRA